MHIHSAKDFGNTIKKTRKALRLTQPQIAGASGVGIRFIVDLEHGKPTCSLDKAIRVATMLGLKLDMQNPEIIDQS